MLIAALIYAQNANSIDISIGAGAAAGIGGTMLTLFLKNLLLPKSYITKSDAAVQDLIDEKKCDKKRQEMKEYSDQKLAHHTEIMKMKLDVIAGGVKAIQTDVTAVKKNGHKGLDDTQVIAAIYATKKAQGKIK